MTFWTLIRRSLRFHARSHFGVVLGAAIGSAALIGALVVGDSVRGSLRERGLEGLGQVEFALSLPDRFVTETLARRFLGRSTGSWPEDDGSTRGFYLGKPAGALILPALAAREDGEARANRVSLIGVGIFTNAFNNNQVSFWDFATRDAPLRIQPGEVWLDEPLAAQLRVRAGDNVILRVKQASATAGDTAISPRSRPSEALRLRVAGIRAGADLGNFSLRPAPAPPLNAFVNLQQLQEALNLTGRVNTVIGFGIFREHQTLQRAAWSWLQQLGLQGLIGRPPGGRRDRPPAAESVEHYAASLKARFKLPDLEAALSISASDNYAELKSRRVFLDPPLALAALAAETNARPILTYLANVLAAGTNATPYSIVTAAGPPWTPAGMGDDEIVVNAWLADDLGVRAGDTLGLGYFQPETGARLEEATNRFRVRAIVPMEPPWADRTLMPDFPGIESAERASDWDAGFPLVHKIRPQDEEYWKRYRGTPKAFVTLAAGQKLWGNRFGNLTAVRFPLPAGVAAPEFRDTLETNLVAAINPAELGLRFEPVLEQALNAAEQSQDFGQLFLGFSIFLVVAALILMALLFQFGLEQRVTEVGTLLALGFTAKEVRRLFLREGAALALAGGILGALGGLGYAQAMLWGLTTVWRSAVGTSALRFHVTLMTLVIGLTASTLVAVVTIWLALRKQARRPARELLAGEIQSPKSKVQSREPEVWRLWTQPLSPGRSNTSTG
jgi:ABC-type lipoprotein release transport system permease subunit